MIDEQSNGETPKAPMANSTTSQSSKKYLLFIPLGILGVVLIAVALVLWGPSDSFEVVLENEAPLSQEEDVAVLPVVPDPVQLGSTSVTVGDGTVQEFMLAEPFELAVAAEGVGKARFMAESPDGRLFVPDLVDYQLSHEGKVYILEDFNEETREFETKHEYLSGLRGSNSVAFYTDGDGKHWLYLALTAHLVRYPYEPGDTAPSGEPEIILEFPNTQAPEAKSVVWHITRTIEFHEDRLYISIGSGCNACEQPEGEMRAMVASVMPDGSDMRVVADGLRNAVGFTWMNDELVVTENGADHLGSQAPDEVVYRIAEEGDFYGWPYCYESDGEVLLDTTTQWETPVDCQTVPTSLASFAPRSAPLGIEYFEDVHSVLDGTMLVALHGSFDQSMMSGYEIVRVTPEGEQDVFMDGFQLPNTERIARPVDFHEWRDGFLFTDDYGGRVYYVYAE